jgi:hypothetical protein
MAGDDGPGDLRPDASVAELRSAFEDLRRRLSDWESKQARGTSESVVPSGRSISAVATAFTVMPFGPANIQWIYEKTVRPTLEKCDVNCVRGDDMFGSEAIMEDVLAGIDDAVLVVADLTGQNANVFYEVGIAHAKDKPVLLLAQSLDDVPFDLRHRRILVYEYSPPGVEELAEKLEKHARAMLQQVKRAAR